MSKKMSKVNGLTQQQIENIKIAIGDEQSKISLAKTELEQAIYQKGNASNNLKLKEEKYYTTAGALDEYAEILRNRYIEESKVITAKWKEQFDDKYEEIMELITYYKSQYNYIPEMQDMKKIYTEKNKNLYGKLEKDLNESNISKRLADYYDNLNNVQSFVNSYLKYIYWGFFIIMVFIFIYKREWGELFAYPLIIFFLFFPIFLLNVFTSFIFRNMNHVQIDALYLSLAIAVILMISSMIFLSNLALK